MLPITPRAYKNKTASSVFYAHVVAYQIRANKIQHFSGAGQLIQRVLSILILIDICSSAAFTYDIIRVCGVAEVYWPHYLSAHPLFTKDPNIKGMAAPTGNAPAIFSVTD